ncbi:elongation factor G [Bifidobacterium pseudolongum]|uniref:elongation factor G n=1 Tax=Bifidobacterium pseudolongum TaxID=1694 RepID=UPI00050636A9|nr:TetM/TetW/TetO/TetS family tetracycline resistance ribosomal protection protein [Bifidobacterium pseudolongum]KFI77624.1 translation elongation factor [Bifidobacterium pseudolongum subsp. pseudolongum]WCA41257.1 TetM/TetW/TetO/TetS family tetracycline resistance ribosomal protection protein [Bifidobacterium pseudolongum subsp. pseudolongum]
MKRIVTGIVAHVDAGKTTLSEALLYATGTTRKLGRVDHGDAFLDTDAIERARGITIYTEPAVMRVGDVELTILDTPGHVDFSAETERTLQALDYAILVVSAADGVQGHTLTLWRLLQRYHVPVFVFVNKMDAPGASRTRILDQLHARCSDACIDFTAAVDGLSSDQLDALAMQSEAAMDEYLETGGIDVRTVRGMIADGAVVPVYFGAALKMQGISEFLEGFAYFTREPRYTAEFGACVFKISHDRQGNRLSWIKVTGGELTAKMMLSEAGGAEKVDQVRVYSGAKFTTVESVPAGTVCAVTGPAHTFPGEGLGAARNAAQPVLRPVLTYTLLPGGNDMHACLQALRELEDEEPLLHVVWQERLQEAHVQLMGAVQLEIIEQLMHDRFGLDIAFGPGSILYAETITAPGEGVGHFEPLHHYAEVHVLIEPLKRGSGLEFATDVSEDELDRNWQRLIMQHLQETEHPGVLIGAPITDMRLTLIGGRGHLKHTEGGDFRQATYRAVRQGLMEAREAGHAVLLEPWYRFRLELPQEMLGRALSDVQRMGGESAAPQIEDGLAVVEGAAPVSEMRDYAMDVNAYTHGEGRLALMFGGYRECHDEQTVVEAADYDPEADLEHTPDSVFCAHGAGYTVKWYKVPEFCHVPMRRGVGINRLEQ